MTISRRGISTLIVLVALVCGGMVLLPTQAEACSALETDCGDEAEQEGPDDAFQSSGNVKGQLNTPTKSCSVYANGGGMGMHCVTVGGDAKTLRERFGDQKLQMCRYSEIPPTIEAPYNASESEGRFMLMTCLGNIDFDTYSGGPDRTLDISIVFVEHGTDIEDRDNGITRFLWDSFNDDKPMPVPFMQTKPNSTPLVGIPTYFTFRWMDPLRKTVVADGPYEGRANGGPFREINEGGVVMRARATKIVVDPRQEGIKAATCDPETPYREGADPKDQPANACSITFERSSASARKYATKPIPSNIKDAFYADVTVTWQVTYGPAGGDMRTLGDGFTMRLRQVLPVQEVQAPNQPPAVIY